LPVACGLLPVACCLLPVALCEKERPVVYSYGLKLRTQKQGKPLFLLAKGQSCTRGKRGKSAKVENAKVEIAKVENAKVIIKIRTRVNELSNNILAL